MPNNKHYPVKILENLYVLDVADSRGFEKEEFLTSAEDKMIEVLIFKNPSFSFKNEIDKRKIYTPSLDNFIISTFEKKPLSILT